MTRPRSPTSRASSLRGSDSARPARSTPAGTTTARRCSSPTGTACCSAPPRAGSRERRTSPSSSGASAPRSAATRRARWTRPSAGCSRRTPCPTPPHYRIGITSLNGRRRDLRDGYTLLRDLYEAGWRRENRPYWLGNVLARYDAATRLWLGRIDRFNDVLAQWWSTKQLPSPSELGLPSR